MWNTNNYNYCLTRQTARAKAYNLHAQHFSLRK